MGIGNIILVSKILHPKVILIITKMKHLKFEQNFRSSKTIEVLNLILFFLRFWGTANFNIQFTLNFRFGSYKPDRDSYLNSETLFINHKL